MHLCLTWHVIKKGHLVSTTYAEAGVSIAEGDRFVKEIKRNVRSTYTPQVIGDNGAFGGFFDARFASMRHPVLVSSIDGVGTKLKVAELLECFDTIGQDLVNHCVNDILVCGARPLYFLDYFATGKLRVEVAAEVIKGMSRACRENGCALIGGETAEMPGIYHGNDFDLAGTIVGVVEKSEIVNGKKIRKGDVLVGLPSTGLHTNGFSLARAVLLKDFSVRTFVEELQETIGQALLRVHKSYLPAVAPLLRTSVIRGLAHITGGGIIGNTSRILPHGRSLRIDWDSWQRPPIFSLIQRIGEVPEEDMRKTFNLGIGLVIVARKNATDELQRRLRRKGERSFVIGEVA